MFDIAYRHFIEYVSDSNNWKVTRIKKGEYMAESNRRYDTIKRFNQK
jgi:hypothetical protein